jgi:hypothetical protein
MSFRDDINTESASQKGRAACTLPDGDMPVKRVAKFRRASEGRGMRSAYSIVRAITNGEDRTKDAA